MVSIVDFQFNPSTITVSAGTVVAWTNSGGTTHTVTANTSLFDSGNLIPNGAFQFTFATAGTYQYHCAIHPQMTGTVTVTP